MGTSGNVFERLPARIGRTCTIFDDSKNLASSSLKLGLDAEGIWPIESRVGSEETVVKGVCLVL